MRVSPFDSAIALLSSGTELPGLLLRHAVAAGTGEIPINSSANAAVSLPSGRKLTISTFPVIYENYSAAADHASPPVLTGSLFSLIIEATKTGVDFSCIAIFSPLEESYCKAGFQ